MQQMFICLQFSLYKRQQKAIHFFFVQVAISLAVIYLQIKSEHDCILL